MTTILSATGIEGYRAFLHERDGEADLLNRTLTHREDFFAKIAAEPVRSRQHIDEETFLRNLRRRRPEDGLSPQMYWLLARPSASELDSERSTASTAGATCHPSRSTSSWRSTTTPGSSPTLWTCSGCASKWCRRRC